MAVRCSRLAPGLLYCLGAACLLQSVAAKAAVSGGSALVFEWRFQSIDPHLITTQVETSPVLPPPVLPSLVLPPDATAGSTTFRNLMRMGDSAMLHDNIVQARSFYEQASAINPASAAALLAVGKTYDANILSSLGRHSSDLADSVIARKWYQRARTLGDPSAAEFMARLP